MITGGVPGSADGLTGEAIQIAPPFIITEEQMDTVVSVLRDAIIQVVSEINEKQ